MCVCVCVCVCVYEREREREVENEMWEIAYEDNFINNFVYKKKKGSIVADAKGMWVSM